MKNDWLCPGCLTFPSISLIQHYLTSSMLLCSIYRYAESLKRRPSCATFLNPSANPQQGPATWWISKKLKSPAGSELGIIHYWRRLPAFLYHLVVGYIYIVTPAKFIELDFQTWVQCQPMNHMLHTTIPRRRLMREPTWHTYSNRSLY